MKIFILRFKISQHIYPPLNPNATSIAKSAFILFYEWDSNRVSLLFEFYPFYHLNVNPTTLHKIAPHQSRVWNCASRGPPNYTCFSGEVVTYYCLMYVVCFYCKKNIMFNNEKVNLKAFYIYLFIYLFHYLAWNHMEQVWQKNIFPYQRYLLSL
jgi:hypothetical protein